MIPLLLSNKPILSYLSVGVDQYLAILYPLEYSTKVTRRSSWKLVSLVWILGLGASVLGSLQLTVSHSPWAACRHALKTRPQEWWLNSQVHRAWIAGIMYSLMTLPKYLKRPTRVVIKSWFLGPVCHCTFYLRKQDTLSCLK